MANQIVSESLPTEGNLEERLTHINHIMFAMAKALATVVVQKTKTKTQTKPRSPTQSLPNIPRLPWHITSLTAKVARHRHALGVLYAATRHNWKSLPEKYRPLWEAYRLRDTARWLPAIAEIKLSLRCH